MQIPVFVSCPSLLTSKQWNIRLRILEILGEFNIQAVNIGSEDYPSKNPLQEVLILAKHCSGGIILGFKQYEFKEGKKIRTRAKIHNAILPTPWNQLEAGILYAQRLPLLIFRESKIDGGIFDPGVTENFIHNMPIDEDFDNEDKAKKIKQLINTFAIEVRENFRGGPNFK